MTTSRRKTNSKKSPYEFANGDYIKRVSGVGLCSIKGRREIDQQDALAACKVDISSIQELSSIARAQVLTKTVAHMQENYAHTAWLGGTTLCSAITWFDENNIANVTVTNIGDSAAYLLVIDCNNMCRVTQLNKLHSTNPQVNEEEYKRFEKAIDCRVCPKPHSLETYADYRFGGLNLTRSIGDRSTKGIKGMGNNSLAYVPDINQAQYQLDTQELGFVLVVSDGVLESLDLNSVAISKLINREMTVDQMASAFVVRAHSLGSNDHISAVVIPFGKSALVADGHGEKGEVVANAIAENFYPVLQNTLNAYQAAKERSILLQLEDLLESYCWRYDRLECELNQLKEIANIPVVSDVKYKEKDLEITTYCLHESLSMLVWPEEVVTPESRAELIRTAVPEIFSKLEENKNVSAVLSNKVNAVLNHIRDIPVSTKHFASFFPAKIEKSVMKALVAQLENLDSSFNLARINIPINEECIADLLRQYQDKLPSGVVEKLGELVGAEVSRVKFSG